MVRSRAFPFRTVISLAISLIFSVMVLLYQPGAAQAGTYAPANHSSYQMDDGRHERRHERHHERHEERHERHERHEERHEHERHHHHEHERHEHER